MLHNEHVHVENILKQNLNMICVDLHMYSNLQTYQLCSLVKLNSEKKIVPNLITS